jgi:predicted deacylase
LRGLFQENLPTKQKGRDNLSSALTVGDTAIQLGERKTVQLKVAALYDFTSLTIPVEVIRGDKSGPTVFISAAIHGDELNGVEIIRRLLKRNALRRLQGTLLAVPIVNVYGFNNKSRYLPDRRDLNRSFPGSASGSLAARLANVFMKQIVLKSDYGIDLHTGAAHRENLPQIRVRLDNPKAAQLAKNFGAPVTLNSNVRDGSLREAASKVGIPILVFEGGEALRFNESVIRLGVKGCLSVLQAIGMLPSRKPSSVTETSMPSFVARESYWIRAPRSGSFINLRHLGDRIEEGEVLAIISDPLGKEDHKVINTMRGIIIGVSCIPLVNQGDAMFHVATFKNSRKVRRIIERYENEFIDE